jgi:hypothetical protein
MKRPTCVNNLLPLCLLFSLFFPLSQATSVLTPSSIESSKGTFRFDELRELSTVLGLAE